MLDVLDASAMRRWCSASLDALTAQRGRIDDLNVFPVADGDTGTNLGQTLGAASEAMRAIDSADASTLLHAMAEGAARGARGNSGVILAQLLSGLAATAREESTGDGAINACTFARGLARGAGRARAALAEPVDGTILSVADAAGSAALAVGCGSAGSSAREAQAGVGATARAAADAGAVALQRTPSQLAALAEAGVVDAGGLGLVLILDALAGVLSKEWSPRAHIAVVPITGDARAPRDAGQLERERETGSEEFGYEAQYLLAAPEAALVRLRVELGGLGDSLAIVAVGPSLWNVHVHVNDVGAAIEAGLRAGRPDQITVTRFADQQALRSEGRPDSGPGAPRVAVVAVAPGHGLGHLFSGEGIAVVEMAPDSDSAAALRADVVKAVLATRAPGVVVLAGAGWAHVADAAAEEVRPQGRDVAVLSLRSPLQGLAALAVHDPARRFADDVAAMAEAAGATRWAEVSIARAAALTMVGWCATGDALGLIEGEVAGVGTSIIDVAAALLDRILAVSGELVTLLPGADMPAAVVEALQAHLAATAPHVEVSVLQGGQVHPPLLLGVE
ncbi:MAG: Dak phosphatase [Jatrophihabitantaceae bacterium]|nr:Dak phosphatase [Jatrophihabitantaceae bacterium]